MKRIFTLFIIIGLIGMIECTTGSSKIATTNASQDKDRLQTIKEKGIITIVSPPKEIPFFYVEPETKEISGIDADIINEIAKRLGINKVEVKEESFSNLFERLKTDNSIDMAVGGIFITPEREESLEFTKLCIRKQKLLLFQSFLILIIRVI